MIPSEPLACTPDGADVTRLEAELAAAKSDLAAAARADAPRTDEAVAQCLATPDGACDASAPWRRLSKNTTCGPTAAAIIDPVAPPPRVALHTSRSPAGAR